MGLLGLPRLEFAELVCIDGEVVQVLPVRAEVTSGLRLRQLCHVVAGMPIGSQASGIDRPLAIPSQTARTFFFVA